MDSYTDIPEPPGPCDSSVSSVTIHFAPPSTTVDEFQLAPRFDCSPRKLKAPVSIESESLELDLLDKIFRSSQDSFDAPVELTSASTESQDESPQVAQFIIERQAPTSPRYTLLMKELLNVMDKEIGEDRHSELSQSFSTLSSAIKSQPKKSKKKMGPRKVTSKKKRRKTGATRTTDTKDLENRCIELMVEGDGKDTSSTTLPSVDLKPLRTGKQTNIWDASYEVPCCSPMEDSASIFSEPELDEFKTDTQNELNSHNQIKSNLASTLREAATFAKDAAKEEEMLVHLLSKSTTVAEYEAFLANMRDRLEAERIVEVQRKRLEGLLSFEEAVKAKIRLVAENVAKGQIYLEEKKRLIEKLHQLHNEIDRKNKAKISDVKEQHKKREESVLKTLLDKQSIGAAVLHEKQELMKIKEENDTMELERKTFLIKEFKILHTIRKEHIKEVRDEKLNMLRKMSADEIQARLIIFKRQFKEELIAKQRAVNDSRTRATALKNAVVEMIEEHKKRKILNRERREITSKKNQFTLESVKGGRNLIELHKKLIDLKKARLVSKEM